MNNNDYKKTGNLIKKLRTDRNIKQSELAKTLHVTNAAISQWENGQSIRIENLYSISKYFDITVTELLQGKLNMESNEEYWRRNYDLSMYEFKDCYDEEKIKEFYQHILMVKEQFLEYLPKWSQNQLSETKMKEFNFLMKYFKFDNNYYSYCKSGLQSVKTFAFSEEEKKEFTCKRVEEISSLNIEEQKWELSKIFDFTYDIKVNEICESGSQKGLEYLLKVYSQVMKDQLLMANMTHEVKADDFIGKYTNNGIKTLDYTDDEIEQIWYFKTMLNSGCRCMQDFKPISYYHDLTEEEYHFIEGKKNEIIPKLNDDINKIGLFRNFAGQRQISALYNWKLFSLNEYELFVDKEKTNHLKMLVNYKDKEPQKYFEHLLQTDRC